MRCFSPPPAEEALVERLRHAYPEMWEAWLSTESRPPHDALDQIMKVDEVSSLLSLPRSTVSDYARREILPSFKLGRHRRFLRSDVLAKVEQLRQPGNAEA